MRSWDVKGRGIIPKTSKMQKKKNEGHGKMNINTEGSGRTTSHVQIQQVGPSALASGQKRKFQDCIYVYRQDVLSALRMLNNLMTRTYNIFNYFFYWGGGGYSIYGGECPCHAQP